MSNEEGLRVSVSVSKKVNLGNYQSADMFLAVSNIEVGAQPGDIREAIETGELAFVLLEEAIDKKVRALREQQQQAARPTPPKPQGARA